ncbi:MAG: hypothetical protein NTX61_08265 [Bacteroidetes bacterium]|nr:hypothetical protein [Bacteroidota bacterium]
MNLGEVEAKVKVTIEPQSAAILAVSLAVAGIIIIIAFHLSKRFF